MTQSSSLSVASLRIPPPELVRPFAIVRPERVTRPEVTWKMRKDGVAAAVLRLTVRLSAPGPLILSVLLTSNSPLVSVIVPVIDE